MRKKPWEFIEKVMFDVRDLVDPDEPRMLVVTGIGGCGKTQLTLKFIQVYKNKSVIYPGSFNFLFCFKICSNTLHQWQ
jgi:predicted AAA+ superfamily ATPase